jgi:hypothetical protein
MTGDKEGSLEELAIEIEELRTEINKCAGILDNFVRDGLFRSRPATISGDGQLSLPETPRQVGNPTAAAFTLFLLARSGSLQQQKFLSTPNVIQIASDLQKEVITGHATLEVTTTDTATLPNPYNSSIQLAGTLASTRQLRLEITPELANSLGQIVTYLIENIRKNGGFVLRLEKETRSAPSCYLTYWAAMGLAEALRSGLFSDQQDDLSSALQQISRWAERALALFVADHHAGLSYSSRFDVVEMACASACVLQFDSSDEALSIARHALSILFRSYFLDGCLAPSKPVLADRANNRSVQCPTAEALEYILRAELNRVSRVKDTTYKPALIEHKSSLYASYMWLIRNKIAEKGFVPERTNWSEASPTAFMTASALALIIQLEYFLDYCLNLEARILFNITRPKFEPWLARLKYPANLERVLHDFVIEPIKAGGESRKSAWHSMIFYGPPGTAKTSLAKRLAMDLGWPYLIITQRDFLTRGRDMIDAAADQIFRNIIYLRDVVVLFDELEELILERAQSPDKESRLLTTSMLPRIHELRDKKRIVFILATNWPQKLDEAAIRLGRFDLVKCIMPPEKREREALINSLVEERIGRYGSHHRAKVSEAIRNAGIVNRTERFSYKDIEYFIDVIANEVRKGVECSIDMINRELEGVRPTVSEETLTKFKRIMAEQDRPRPVAAEHDA